MPKKAITGLAWYNILANPHYAQAFNYVSVGQANRTKLIKDAVWDDKYHDEQSDLVCALINLAYLRYGVARKINLVTGKLIKLR